MTSNSIEASNDFKRTEVVKELSTGCSLETFKINSSSMNRQISVRVILPPAYTKKTEKTFPVLYALHGRGAPYEVFSNMVKLKRLLAEKPMIIITFDGMYSSYYLDAPNDGVVDKTVLYGKPKASKRLSGEALAKKIAEFESIDGPYLSKYPTFFFDEFIPAIDQWYRTDKRRRAITGFSMGGFGAMHMMLEKPNQFKAVSGMSSVCMSGNILRRRIEKKNLGSLEKILGPYADNKKVYERVLHLERIGQYLKDGTVLPPIFQYCGDEDFLLEDNQEMAKEAKSLGLNFTYKEGPGNHNWNFWASSIVDILEFHWKYFNQDSN